ncbi:hypothetical protein T439DRAFT_379722 [Meredithblackwellia eburnea MCA 4105]
MEPSTSSRTIKQEESLITNPPKPRTYTPVISDLARSPFTPWTISGILLAAVPTTVRSPTGFPHLVQLPLFAAIFGGAGYMVHAGDPVNGSGTATAWSLTYLFLHGKKSLLSRRPGPMLLSSAVALLASVEGADYFLND